MNSKKKIGSVFFESGNYYLKTLTYDHVSEKYLGWLMDIEVVEFLEVRFILQTLSSISEFIRQVEVDDSRYLFGLFEKKTHYHIGNASILNINYHHQTFDIGYLVGDKAHWGTSASIETCHLLLYIAFEKLSLRKCFSGVYANHIKSRFNMKRMGFSQECTLKEHLIYQGKIVDEVIYSMSCCDWKEILKNLDEVKFESVLDITK